jgi:monoamine oxidase
VRSYEPDVCVIGGGVAGLIAAGQLASNGQAVLLLEARQRLGGRIHTQFAAGHPDLPAELGAEFVHGRHPSLYEFCKQNNLALSEMDGTPYRDSGDGLKPAGEEDSVRSDVLLSSSQLAEADEPFSQFLERSHLHARDRHWVKSFVEGFNAADYRQIGTRALYHQQMAEQSFDGDHASRVNRGYTTVVNALEKRLPTGVDVLLGSVVNRIQWQPGNVTVEARTVGADVIWANARAVIVTVPLGVLLAEGTEGHIQFSPEPDIFRDLNLLAPGEAARLNLVFREPVWERTAPNAGFLLSRDPNFPTWWPRTAPSGYLLTGWSGGPKVRNLPLQSLDEMTTVALETLAKLLHTHQADLRSKLESVHFHDWQSDPFSLGAYSYVKAGGFEFSQQIASGIENTLWLAGEAIASDGTWGTVHGAMASGHRAAQDLLRTR